MTGDAMARRTAKWSREAAGTLLIADAEDNIMGSYAVTPSGNCPGPGILWRTGWVAYLGTEWLEEPPGLWSRAVFEESRAGGQER
jgi:hypothetical protein